MFSVGLGLVSARFSLGGSVRGFLQGFLEPRPEACSDFGFVQVAGSGGCHSCKDVHGLRSCRA